MAGMLPRLFAAVAVVLVLVTSACSSDDGGVPPEPSGSPSPHPSLSTAAQPGAGSPTTDVPSPTASPTLPGQEPTAGGSAGEPRATAGPATQGDRDRPSPQRTTGEVDVVAVELTAWGPQGRSFAARASVHDVDGDGPPGRCTMTLVSGSRSLEASGPATEAGSSQLCSAGLDVPLTDLGDLRWTLHVAYEAAHHAGRSAAVEVSTR